MPFKIQTSLKVTDNVDNENYIISGMNPTNVTLEHLPSGRREKKEDWVLVWEKFDSLFAEKQISIEGFDQELENISEIFSNVCNDEIEKLQLKQETQDLTEKQKTQLEEHQNYRNKVESIRLDRRKKINPGLKNKFDKKTRIKDEMDKFKKNKELEQQLKIYKDISEKHYDEKTRKQYKIKYEMLLDKVND